MRKYGVILLALFHAALLAAAPLREESGNLVRYENVQNENGYRFSYETKDGQTREEEGEIDAKSGVLRVSGRYSYRTPDGGTYRVDFVADKNGYRTTEQPRITKRPTAPPTTGPVRFGGGFGGHITESFPLSDNVLKSLIGIPG